MTHQPELWTIDQLGQRVAEALADGYQGPANRQVRPVPNRRSIRYYTTLGLIDRPTSMRGRTALYSQRHLMQLVAIKRLQVQGLALAQVQQQLIGLSDVDLAAIACLPGEPAAQSATAQDAAPPPQRRFWAATPELPDPATVAPVQPTPAAAPAEQAQNLALLAALPLAGGVTLLLDPARELTPHDLMALSRAAAPLLETLRSTGLLGDAAADPAVQGDKP